MKKNLLSILGLLIGVLGIVLSFFFYEKSKIEREPTFIVDPLKTEILDSKSIHLAPIKVFMLDSVEIRDDLTSTTFYFWNKGKEPIRRDDLLKEVLIQLDTLVKIVDFKVLKSSRDVCKIRLIKTDSRTLKLDFDILEYNDGFTAQIIYEGQKNSKLSISTVIVGVNKISNFAVSQYKLLGKTITNIGIGIFLIFLLLAMGSSGSSNYDPDYIRLKESEKYKENEEYKINVDRLAEIERNAAEVRDVIYEREKTDISPESEAKKQSRKRFWIRFGVTTGIIIVFVVLIIVWRVTKNEIYDNPVQYIPESIRPNNN